MSPDWKRLHEIVAGNQRFLVTGHVRPDGDSIGSVLGMTRILRQLGKEVLPVSPSPVPPRYRFLDADSEIRWFAEQIQPAALNEIDVVMILDTSAWGQLAGFADYVKQTPAKKVIIDHHIGHDDMGAELFKDVTASACGAMIVEAVEPLGAKLTLDVANPLFVAMATDTGWFRFPSADGRTFRLAARLIDAGVQVNEMYRALFEENSEARLRLVARVLNSLEITAAGRIAYFSVSLKDFQETGAVPQDTEDLVNYTVSMTGVKIGMIFIEQVSGETKVSFRSRNGIDCTPIAGHFGGGGHRAAAGATLSMPLTEAIANVVGVAQAALAEAP